MAIVIRNDRLEKKLRAEMRRRGHKTLARTACELIAEHFASEEARAQIAAASKTQPE